MAGQPGPAKGRPGRKLVPAIYVFVISRPEDVDARYKRGHDDLKQSRTSVARPFLSSRALKYQTRRHRDL